MKMPALGSILPPVTNRPLDMLATDTAAVRAIAQAAVSVELFTIPLYMATMYSIQGTHQINSRGVSYYLGRQWPGMSTTAKPVGANQEIFNIIFSVFIQEMLHLQMAANIATALGAAPTFTGSELQNLEHGWTCYGPTLSTIPHIVDLKDTSNYQHVRVNLEELNANQCDLFLAIEQDETKARDGLRAFDKINHTKYFPEVPLAGWTPGKNVNDLPLFGTIGHMYDCYARYISMEYTDGLTLWDKLFDSASVQQDMFNVKSDGHPKAEYTHFKTSLNQGDDNGLDGTPFNMAIDMMATITDQGEGNSASIKRYRRGGAGLLKAVAPDYREDDFSLKADYPAYTNDGADAESRDAAARFDSAALDHYERFQQVKEKLSQVVTWKQWHGAGNNWTKDMLINEHYASAPPQDNIPLPEDVAAALNRLKAAGQETLTTLSTVATGAIFGITSVLDDYWRVQGTVFPYPSMVGAGDRMSICWAVLGQAPDLSVGVPPIDPDVLYHACQGMNLGEIASDSCAALAVYHTCRGSNSCHAQGGCGFAQPDAGGASSCGGAASSGAAAGAPSSCGHSVKVSKVGGSAGNLCGAPKPPADLYSAPSDNKCRTFGGCAVPISASQLFPNSTPGTMKLYDFNPEPPHGAIAMPQTLSFTLGESVYDKAWQVYGEVVAKRGGQPVGTAPKPTDLRLALPPST